MNIIKVQQELMAELPAAVRVPYYHLVDEQTTILVNTAGSACYLIPTPSLYLDLRHFRKLENLPSFLSYKDTWDELHDTGATERGSDGKPLLVYEGEGKRVYFDKNLLKHFAKGAKFYQDKNRMTAVAVIEQGAVVAYVMPCRPPKKENQ